ncbi:SMI1/KNR4 family protein [Streptomyces sp. NPDC002133]|uniref:SMI1/KNR4 family protein n=1 Tax=Streptomyces sp. NPDC002133 TaxID=3154409 RepID=UPI00332036D1
MDNWDGERVRAQVRQMSARDPQRRRFGAQTHQYVLAPRLEETQIGAFEESHGIALPQEYRSFVAQVGNGPAGPGHGLMPLTTARSEAAEEWAADGEWEDDRLPGRLREPFPLAEPLPGPMRTPTDLTVGTLILAELGCGMYIRLVVSGPRAGEIWQIDPDWGGFVPVSPGFHAWYTEWLTIP